MTRKSRNAKSATRRDTRRSRVPAAHIEAAREQFAQTEKIEHRAIIESYADAIGKPRQPDTKGQAQLSTSTNDQVRHKLSNGNRALQSVIPERRPLHRRCNIIGSPEFDNGSSPDHLKPFHDYAPGVVPDLNIARRYSRADPSNGEMALILMVGDAFLSSYAYPPIDGSQYLFVDMHSVAASLENIVLPKEAPPYDIEVTVEAQMPTNNYYIDPVPTIDGAFGGFVRLVGSVRLEFYAWTPSGIVYDVTGSHFLDIFAVKNAQDGFFYEPMTVLHLETQVPEGAAFMITRVTTRLLAMRTLTSDGVSPTGGAIGAAIADPSKGDPSTGIWAPTDNMRRARITMLRRTCDSSR